ncbi:hypothetical protein BCR41DRAFT_376080 [Lobosporangium transversale]|uniref:Uncharacterized protein n=1 Tax=Lobosporangium transversale TaxID=64571 RepID=A0A1Y2G737_9FUNG|nr:hypothetical protein BCR41DRAFT_376080 [Lobosporangium transversale]ORY91811.1 hypothetical protein BCR41DRAFT_376080 [Lobosporangium transversale]|eukprot:XP_021875123.1 hypothetical protein BCR41DRAFT_376080 [Lobosporangium transversale]
MASQIWIVYDAKNMLVCGTKIYANESCTPQLYERLRCKKGCMNCCGQKNSPTLNRSFQKTDFTFASTFISFIEPLNNHLTSTLIKNMNHSEEAVPEGCHYNNCEKLLPLSKIRSRELKDDSNVAYKKLDISSKHHYGRYHKDCSTTFNYRKPDIGIDRLLEVHRDSQADYNYICVF